MNSGEWWAAVHKAAQYWQAVKGNQINLACKEISRMTDGSRTDTPKLSAEVRRNARDKRRV